MNDHGLKRKFQMKTILNEDALEIKDDPQTEDDLKWRRPQRRGNLN